MLTIKNKVSQYQKNGSAVFVGSVTGTEEELNAYAQSQGTNLRRVDNLPDGDMLYFSMRPIEAGAELKLTKSGRFTVLQDLEATIAQRETAKINNLGKFDAIQQFAGLSKAQMVERLFAA